MKTTVTFDRSAAELVIALIGAEVCSFCNTKVTPENFAGAAKGKYCCNNINCLFHLSDLIRKAEEVKP